MMWNRDWRGEAWEKLTQPWDVLIIGGGITGAGILRYCVQSGLKAALVEARDFASGTSSRSSKLVHGGLRYLKNAQFKVTLESVREREYLLRQGKGLVQRLGFLYTCLEGDAMPGWVFRAGLILYDLMARQWSHQAYDVEEVRRLCPPISTDALRRGYRYFDAITDDSRLVLRLLRESEEAGGLALNYARAVHLLRQGGRVCGAMVRDESGDSGREVEVQARVVINAGGAWADEVRGWLGKPPRLRPLRGSHLVIPFERLPLTRAVSFLHPRDGRPVFALPWEGVVLFGTTDVDHRTSIQSDPVLSTAEAEYLLEGLQAVFPAQELRFNDVISVYSGLRPVINTGKADPSKESREHAIWIEDGLLTVSGGKLTTFRIMAREAVRAVRSIIGHIPFRHDVPVLGSIEPSAEIHLAEWSIPAPQRLRLLGRYGGKFVNYLVNADGSEGEPIEGTPYMWAEVGYALEAEAVIHLDDLMLRRLRLGLITLDGGQAFLPRIGSLVREKLNWSGEQWEEELAAYHRLWKRAYSLEQKDA